MNSSFSTILICYIVHVDEYTVVSLRIVTLSCVYSRHPQEDYELQDYTLRLDSFN